MKYFVWGSICGGAAVSFVSCFVLHDAGAAFWQLCLGYVVFACLSGAIYAGALKCMAFALRRVTQEDAWRGLASGAISTAAQYAVTSVSGNHESGLILLFLAPVCAAAVDAFRARRERPALESPDSPLSE